MRLSTALLGVAVIMVATCAAQQQTPSDIPEIAKQAPIVFRGTVLAMVAEDPRAPGEMAVMRITLRVEDGIRGTTTGETLTVRQWNVRAAEYRVGETLILFLHAPSEELGLTSPVGGRAGHRRVDEVSPELVNSIRCARVAAAAVPSSGEQLQRPARQGKPR